MEIKLRDGKTVKVAAFNYSETYEGLLEGRPNPGFNRRLVEMESKHHIWGEEKINVIMPSTNHLDDWIPPSVFRVLLRYFDGKESSMVVLWFDNEPGERSLRSIIEKGVENIDWDKEAIFYQ
jgi:hypothetical protein